VTNLAGILIESLYGNCPVQADGTIDGEPFYFRARGDEWAIEIGPGNTHLVVEALDVTEGTGEEKRAASDRIEALDYWRYEEAYGEWPDAGWMTEDEARAFIAKGAELWRASKA
jgi:hypothetical protein